MDLGHKVKILYIDKISPTFSNTLINDINPQRVIDELSSQLVYKPLPIGFVSMNVILVRF